jgi:RNA polymerase sigma factor (sigma-70 family)
MMAPWSTERIDRYVVQRYRNRSPRPGQAPPVAAERAEEARLVQAAVAALPAEHRLVVELRFFAGASLDEIATLVGCPLGTVKSRLHHALEKLRVGRGCVNLFATAGESPVSTPCARP